MKYCCDDLKEAVENDDRFSKYGVISIECQDSDSGPWTMEMNYCIFCGAKL